MGGLCRLNEPHDRRRSARPSSLADTLVQHPAAEPQTQRLRLEDCLGHARLFRRRLAPSRLKRRNDLNAYAVARDAVP